MKKTLCFIIGLLSFAYSLNTLACDCKSNQTHVAKETSKVKNSQ